MPGDGPARLLAVGAAAYGLGALATAYWTEDPLAALLEGGNAGLWGLIALMALRCLLGLLLGARAASLPGLGAVAETMLDAVAWLAPESTPRGALAALAAGVLLLVKVSFFGLGAMPPPWWLMLEAWS